jgi:hypothetical protein
MLSLHFAGSASPWSSPCRLEDAGGHRSLVSSDRTAAAMLETRHSERQKFSNGINERTERESPEWALKFNASSSDFDSTIRSLDPSRLSQEASPSPFARWAARRYEKSASQIVG